MTWDNIIKNLITDGGIFVGYDASIGIELDSFIADIPVYRFRVDYMTPETKHETFSTLKDLQMFVLGNESFLKCSECHDPICSDYIENKEADEVYCCLSHMTEAMDRRWGKGGWRFKEREFTDSDMPDFQRDISENDENIEIEGEQDVEVEGEQSIEDFDFSDFEEDKSEDAEYQFEVFDFVEEGSVEKAWRPYHMFFVEHILNKN